MLPTQPPSSLISICRYAIFVYSNFTAGLLFHMIPLQPFPQTNRRILSAFKSAAILSLHFVDVSSLYVAVLVHWHIGNIPHFQSTPTLDIQYG